MKHVTPEIVKPVRAHAHALPWWVRLIFGRRVRELPLPSGQPAATASDNVARKMADLHGSPRQDRLAEGHLPRRGGNPCCRDHVVTVTGPGDRDWGLACRLAALDAHWSLRA